MLTWKQALKIADFGLINSLLADGANAFAYRALSQYWISSGVGAAHSLGIMRQVLPSLHGATYFDNYWRGKQETTQNLYISELGGSDIIDDDFMIETPLSQPRRYRYIGDFAYRDDVTGKVVHEYKSYYSDEKLSVGEANELLYDSFDKDKYPEWRSLEYVRFANVEHNADWSY